MRAASSGKPLRGTWLHCAILHLLGLSRLSCTAADTIAAELSHMRSSGVFVIGSVDSELESLVASVIGDIESATFIRFEHKALGGLRVQASNLSSSSSVGALDLCCFDPRGGDVVQRHLVEAFLQVLGVYPTMATAATSFHAGKIALQEAEAVNKLYASKVLPQGSELPARVDVGIKQLLHVNRTEDLTEMMGGRGRRFVGGTTLWALGLVRDGIMPHLVGAMPTFIFRGNKAEVLLLGQESAVFVPGPQAPKEPPGEGLGSGISRATQYARSLAGQKLVAGIPTHAGDGSLLLLRDFVADTQIVRELGEGLEDILAEHHSAVILAQASRWAQARGALLGLPSFLPVPKSKDDASSALEVVLVGRHKTAGTRTSGAVTMAGTDNAESNTFLHFPLFVAAVVAVLFGWRVSGGMLRNQQSQAERDLARLVDNL